MAQTILFSNNAKSSLAGPITNTDTTANLQAGTGALFPDPDPALGQYFICTIIDAATQQIKEIVHVTDRAGDAITMVRGQEGTSAQNWLAGDFFWLLVTAGGLSAMQQTGTGGGFANIAIYEIIGGVQKVSVNGAAFTTSGATSFTVPVTGLFEVDAVGGGGAGGGVPITTGGQCAVGGGGGTGAAGYVRVTGATPGATVTATVGAAGTGSAGADGGNGGQSSFGTYLVCPGGTGGYLGSAAAPPDITGGGPGGAISTATGSNAINLTGGASGLSGWALTTSGGQSGGGGSMPPFGQGGHPVGTTSAGNTGTGYGFGGSGALALPSNGSTRAGGDGGAGRIIVRY